MRVPWHVRSEEPYFFGRVPGGSVHAARRSVHDLGRRRASAFVRGRLAAQGFAGPSPPPVVLYPPGSKGSYLEAYLEPAG